MSWGEKDLDLNLDSDDTGHVVSSDLSSLICNNYSRLAHLLGLLRRLRQMTANKFCTNNHFLRAETEFC